MLVLWTLGVLFFFLFLKNLSSNDKWLPILMTLVLIVSPAWAVWSMKARGGYIASFVLSSLFLFLLQQNEIRKKAGTQVFLGLLMVIIFESQPLWIPGILVFVGFKLVSMRSFRALASHFMGVLLGIGLFYFLRKWDTALIEFHSPQVFSMPPNLLETILYIPKYAYNNLIGSYYFNQILKHSIATVVAASILCVLSVLGFFFVLVQFFKNKILDPLIYVSLFSVLATLSYSVFIVEFAPRYLLPLVGFLIIFLFLLTRDHLANKTLRTPLLLWPCLSGLCPLTALRISASKMAARRN